jgi:hypothetical protein
MLQNPQRNAAFGPPPPDTPIRVAPIATLLWEPVRRYMRPEHLDEFWNALPRADVVSPNLVEAAAIYGEVADPQQLLNWLDDAAEPKLEKKRWGSGEFGPISDNLGGTLGLLAQT